jgi:carbon storage regulator CsrA
MLVFTRNISETVVLTYKDHSNPQSKEIKVTVSVCQIKGKQVRLGIEAPKDVIIHRGEIQETIDQKIKRIQGGI